MPHIGAKACDDFETEFRIARAILAFSADITKDIFVEDVVFDYIRKDISMEETLLKILRNKSKK